MQTLLTYVFLRELHIAIANIIRVSNINADVTLIFLSSIT